MSPIPERSDWYRTKDMFYVYVLQSKRDSFLYIGSTNNIKSRILRHSEGLVISTRHRRPLNLIFYEAYLMKSDAIRREHYFKTTKGKTTLKMMLKGYFSKSQNEI